MNFTKLAAAVAVTTVLGVGAQAGPIFLTGHDPDFHAQDSVHAQNLLRTGLSYVTGGTFDDGAATKFLWIESRITVPSGHRVGEAGLTAIGLTLGANYDRVNAAEFATVNLSNYTAIAVASTFGGLFGRAELDAMIARKADIQSFINAGRGLLALAECFPTNGGSCGADLLAGATDPVPFGYLPITVGSIPNVAPFTVTVFGAGLGLTNDDVNDPTHNSFLDSGGLNVVDIDAAGKPTTLAGVVGVDDGGFRPVPAPAALALFATGLGTLLWNRRRKSIDAGVSPSTQGRGPVAT